ncbi:MAG: DVUA0089 family protein [Azoarcus sp.]|jgi:hypothetical protein|nr:DVUA0089 family protein [Azoarcus sp.]
MKLKKIALSILISCMSLSATATDFEVNGTFTYANDVLLIPFTLDQDSTISFYTDSAWVTTTGHGGFDPMLVLYSADGVLIGFTATVPSTIQQNLGLGLEDVWMSGPLAAGSYYLGLSQQAHEALSPIPTPLTYYVPVGDLQGWVDSIALQGDVTRGDPQHDYFSLQLEGISSIGAPFYTSGVNLTSINSVPEPETYVMFLAGLGIIGAVARRRRKTVN